MPSVKNAFLYYLILPPQKKKKIKIKGGMFLARLHNTRHILFFINTFILLHVRNYILYTSVL